MGYLVVDNTASGGKKNEYDTTHCRHCQKVIDKRKWRRDGGIWKCSGCDGPVCSECVGLGDDGAGGVKCDPFQAKIERELKAAEVVRQARQGLVTLV